MTDAHSDKNDIEALLPWYVNGTLTAEEERKVRDYMRDNGWAEGDVQLLKGLREAVRSQEFKSPGPFGLQRFRASLDREREKGRSKTGPRNWWAIAAAAAIGVIVLQAALLVESWDRSAVYEPAGVPEHGRLIQVRFEPDATEREVRRVLADAGLEIVKGPSVAGVYRLAPVVTKTDVEQLVEQLRSRTGIVSFAEAD